MRFPSQAGIEDLKTLIASGIDAEAHHILWLAEGGQVNLTPIHPGERSNQVRERIFLGDSIYVHETLGRGHGYVGPEAAADPSWMAELHNTLTYEWEQAVLSDQRWAAQQGR